MLMMIEIDSKQISEQDQDILLHQVWESSIDEGTSFDQYIYLQLMNFRWCIKKYAGRKTSRNLIL